jgi:hypothetical protein
MNFDSCMWLEALHHHLGFAGMSAIAVETVWRVDVHR